MVERAKIFPLGLYTCRDAILDRIKADSEHSHANVVTAAFLKDLHASLRNSIYERQPWSYAKYQGESGEESNSEDEQFLALSSPGSGCQADNIEGKEAAESGEEALVPPGEADRVSQTSGASFQSASEGLTSDHQEDEEENSASSFSEPSIPVFEFSQDDKPDLDTEETNPAVEAPATARPSNRRLQFLLATCQYSALEMAWLKLILEGRKRKHEKDKTAIDSLRKSLQPRQDGF